MNLTHGPNSAAPRERMYPPSPSEALRHAHSNCHEEIQMPRASDLSHVTSIAMETMTRATQLAGIAEERLGRVTRAINFTQGPMSKPDESMAPAFSEIACALLDVQHSLERIENALARAEI